MIVHGICRECGKPAKNPNGTYCQECLDKRSQYREALIKSGICPACKKEPLAVGKRKCATCLDKANDKNRERYRNLTEEGKAQRNGKVNEHKRVRYHALKDQGICTRCATRKAKPGSNLCPICRYMENKRQVEAKYASKQNKVNLPREEWYANRLCYHCGEPNDNFPKKAVCSKCCKDLIKNFRGHRADPKQHPWKQLNEIVFKRKEETVPEHGYI